MANFCKYCGTNIQNASCSCTQSQQQTIQQPVQQQPIQQPVQQQTIQQPVQQQPIHQPVQQTDYIQQLAQSPQVAQAQAMVKKSFNTASALTQSGIGLACVVIKSPIEYIHDQKQAISCKNKLSLLWLECLAVALTFLFICFPLLDYIPLVTVFCTSLFIGVSWSLFVITPAFLCYLAARRNNPNMSLLDACGTFSVAALLPTLSIICALILCKLSYVLLMLTFFPILFFVFVSLYEGILATTKRSRNFSMYYINVVATITYIAYCFIITIAFLMIGEKIGMRLLDNFETFLSLQSW